MADIARDHHFIPQFFLGNFTPSGTKDDLLWVTDRKERKGFPGKPRNVGFQKDFYRADIEGAPPDIVERILGWFEGFAAPAVKHVLEQHSLPDRPEFDHLMELIGLLVIRVPAARQRVDRALDQILKKIVRQRFNNPQVLRTQFEKMRQEGVQGIDYENMDYEELVRFAQNEDRYTISLDKEWFLGQMLQASVPAQKMVFDRNWTVFVADEDAGEFICSDAPVCLTWTDMSRQDRVARLDEHGTDLTVPLGKRTALRGRYEPEQPAVARCDRKMVAHINIRTISSGKRFIYSSNRNFPWKRDNGSIGDWDNLISDLESLHKKTVNHQLSGGRQR